MSLCLEKFPTEGNPFGFASCLRRETLLQHWSHLLQNFSLRLPLRASAFKKVTNLCNFVLLRLSLSYLASQLMTRSFISKSFHLLQSATLRFRDSSPHPITLLWSCLSKLNITQHKYIYLRLPII